MNLFVLERALSKDGWTKPLIRQFANIIRPRLKTSRPYWGGGIVPPRGTRWPHLRDLVSVDVAYPQRHVKFAVPDEKLATVVPLLRQNLENAVDLEREVGPSILLDIAPINPDPNLVGTSSQRDFGINALVLDFTMHFLRLVQENKGAALREVAAWRAGEDPVFERLRVWAAGLGGFLDDNIAGDILANCDDAFFWRLRDQRDLS